jgi:hypothetical protein
MKNVTVSAISATAKYMIEVNLLNLIVIALCINDIMIAANTMHRDINPKTKTRLSEHRAR